MARRNGPTPWCHSAGSRTSAAHRWRTRSLVAVGDACPGEVIRRELDLNAISWQHADAVLAHLAAEVTEDVVAVLQHDPEVPTLERFRGLALEHDRVFLLIQGPRTFRFSSVRRWIGWQLLN